MSEHEIVTAAQAEIVAITEAWRQACAERDQYRRERDQARRERDQARRERDQARALLAHCRTSLAEKHNDPMQDGGAS